MNGRPLWCPLMSSVLVPFVNILLRFESVWCLANRSFRAKTLQIYFHIRSAPVNIEWLMKKFTSQKTREHLYRQKTNRMQGNSRDRTASINFTDAEYDDWCPVSPWTSSFNHQEGWLSVTSKQLVLTSHCLLDTTSSPLLRFPMKESSTLERPLCFLQSFFGSCVQCNEHARSIGCVVVFYSLTCAVVCFADLMVALAQDLVRETPAILFVVIIVSDRERCIVTIDLATPLSFGSASCPKLHCVCRLSINVWGSTALEVDRLVAHQPAATQHTLKH